jgi:hypothetical protein
MFPALVANIGPGWKSVAGANALAYWGHSYVMKWYEYPPAERLYSGKRYLKFYGKHNSQF